MVRGITVRSWFRKWVYADARPGVEWVYADAPAGGIVPEGPQLPPVKERQLWVVVSSSMPAPAMRVITDEHEALETAKRWRGVVGALLLTADYREPASVPAPVDWAALSAQLGYALDELDDVEWAARIQANIRAVKKVLDSQVPRP
jgi:hypothetical protein